jgi:hypothetical protein
MSYLKHSTAVIRGLKRLPTISTQARVTTQTNLQNHEQLARALWTLFQCAARAPAEPRYANLRLHELSDKLPRGLLHTLDLRKRAFLLSSGMNLTVAGETETEVCCSVHLVHLSALTRCAGHRRTIEWWR